MGLCCYLTEIYMLLGAAALYGAYQYYKEYKMKKLLEQWSNTPKDVVIIHGFVRGKRTPNPSPFVLKVMTYCRMAGIKYEMDHKNPIGPKGKSPWISINGEHIADSHFVIKYLNKKFEKNLNGNYSEEKLAIATTTRITCEEYIFWGGVLHRFVYRVDLFPKLITMKFPPWVLYLLMGRRIKARAVAQGIGMHTKDEIDDMMVSAVRAISKILGNNKFFLGDEPCEDDAAIFGMLSQCTWGSPESVIEALVENECPNIRDYCIRMKEKYWPDWEACLDTR